MIDKQHDSEYIKETPSSLLIRWLTGANIGGLGRLYVAGSNRGTALFFGRDRVATLEGGALRILHLHDVFGLRKLANKLGVTVVNFTNEDYKESGWLAPAAYK